MEKIAIYGKGGIGKSTIASNLSVLYAKKGLKVLQIGCDPKQDSTILITKKKIKTVMDIFRDNEKTSVENIIVKGIYGIDCIECGGPKSGVGCAGRGIIKMIEIIEELDLLKKFNYDVVIFDVLGDVVCGGFAAPLREGFADKAFIIISEELMSLYAANNIIHAIKTYEASGVFLGGLILNIKDNNSNLNHLDNFSKKINTRIISKIPRDIKIGDAEKQNKTVVELFPDSDISKKFEFLSKKIIMTKKGMPPTPLSFEKGELTELIQ